VAAKNLGLTIAEISPFVEFVPYGPTEIARLKQAGFVRL
jgi:intracellular sulfur oxidation DsrE/DsrF family protein